MIRWYKKQSANFDANFKILKKCGGKLECLIFERGKKESGPNSILNRTPSFRDSLFNSGHPPFTRFNFNARLPHFMYTGNHFNFLAIDNDDMKPSKRQEYFVSSISVLKLVIQISPCDCIIFITVSSHWTDVVPQDTIVQRRCFFLSKLATLRKTRRCFPYKNSTFITCN